MTKPTTEELKDLLAKVTPDWREDGMTGDDPLIRGNLLRVKTSESHSIFIAAWLDDENDAAEARANATLIALAPTLAAEVVALREVVDMLRTELSALLEAYENPDARICCDGIMCGCMGATNRQYAEYMARQALSQK